MYVIYGVYYIMYFMLVIFLLKQCCLTKNSQNSVLCSKHSLPLKHLWFRYGLVGHRFRSDPCSLSFQDPHWRSSCYLGNILFMVEYKSVRELTEAVMSLKVSAHNCPFCHIPFPKVSHMAKSKIRKGAEKCTLPTECRRGICGTIIQPTSYSVSYFLAFR